MRLGIKDLSLFPIENEGFVSGLTFVPIHIYSFIC